MNIRKFVEQNINNPKLGAFFSGTDTHTDQIGYGITVYNTSSILEAIRNRDILALAANTSFWADFIEISNMTYSILKSHLVRNSNNI